MEAMAGMPTEGPMGSPFGGVNPFMQMNNPFGGGLPPFLKDDNETNDNDSGSFNIDDLVRKIDAKIAEIEKEEKETQELHEHKNIPFEELISNSDEEQEKSKVIDVNVEEKPKEVQESLANMYEDNTNDDDFFDDFFSDD